MDVLQDILLEKKKNHPFMNSKKILVKQNSNNSIPEAAMKKNILRKNTISNKNK